MLPTRVSLALHNQQLRRLPNTQQVISPHQVMGIVEVVEHLSTVQDKVYDEPTVLVVDNVTGEGRGCVWCCVGA